jgi:hypothetical protein
LLEIIPGIHGADPPKEDDDGDRSFKRAGFPTIVFLFGVIIQILTIRHGINRSIDHDWRTQFSLHKSLLGFTIFLNFSAIFLIFGPGAPTPTNILGVLLWFIVCMLFYILLTEDYMIQIAFIFFGIFVEACTLGLVQLFGFGSPVTTQRQFSCNEYFLVEAGEQMDRCADKGYLQFVRLIGLVTAFFLFLAIAVVLINLQYARKASRGLDDSLLGHHGTSIDHSKNIRAAVANPTPSSAAPTAASSFPYQYESMSSITNTTAEQSTGGNPVVVGHL